MRSSKWISLGIGLGLLFLLAAFVLLVSRLSAPIVTAPVAAPVVSSTVGMKASPVVSPSHAISASQAITHSGWLTFTDPEAGYSIRYPASFHVNAGTGKSKGEMYRITTIMFRSPAIPTYQEMSIQVEPNPDDLGIEAMIEKIYENLNGKPLEIKAADALEQMTVAGMTAYKTAILPGSTDFHVLLLYNKKVYHFALVHDLGPMESPPEAKAIFFQILETFKIANLQ